MRHLLVVLFAFAALTPRVYAQEQETEVTLTLIKNVKVFDGTNEQLKDGPVLIENNLIKTVGAIDRTPDGATVIDGGGRVLTPGLTDAHVHLMHQRCAAHFDL